VNTEKGEEGLQQRQLAGGGKIQVGKGGGKLMGGTRPDAAGGSLREKKKEQKRRTIKRDQ